MISSIIAGQYFKISAKHTAAYEFPRNMMRFLCSCFELIAGRVEPHPVVTTGFSIANNYWNIGVGNADAVVEARIGCWSFLESEEKSSHVNERSNATIRALLCIMYPEQVGDDDFVMELFDWFFEMADVVGDFNQSFDALFQGLKGLTPSQS
jgi:hypothetical protein